MPDSDPASYYKNELKITLKEYKILKKVQDSNLTGNFLTLFPIAANIALQTAGAHGGTPTSPTPPTG